MILTVIPISTENAARAELCIDWVRQLAHGNKRGHALLVFDGVHPEFVDRCKISAEMAFESFDMLIPASKDTKEKMASAIVRRNNLFLSAAEYCQRTFRCPFLFLDPDAVPTNPQWMEKIQDAYENQPRRYLLTHLQDVKDGPRFPMACGVYHMGLFNDIAKACADAPEAPWERVAGENIVSRSTKTRMFQPLRIHDEADFARVWPEAQIVVGDSSGAFVEHLREKGIHLPKLDCGGLFLQSLTDEQRFVNPILHIRQPEPESVGTITPKPDLRTKAGREWKAKQANGQKV